MEIYIISNNEAWKFIIFEVIFSSDFWFTSVYFCWSLLSIFYKLHYKLNKSSNSFEVHGYKSIRFVYRKLLWKRKQKDSHKYVLGVQWSVVYEFVLFIKLKLTEHYSTEERLYSFYQSETINDIFLLFFTGPV